MLPALDDEFAKTMDADTMAALTDKVRGIAAADTSRRRRTLAAWRTRFSMQ